MNIQRDLNIIQESGGSSSGGDYIPLSGATVDKPITRPSYIDSNNTTVFISESNDLSLLKNNETEIKSSFNSLKLNNSTSHVLLHERGLEFKFKDDYTEEGINLYNGYSYVYRTGDYSRNVNIS